MGFQSKPYQNAFSVRTLVVYRLNSSGVPIEPILDLLPALGGNRVTLDVITSESFTQGYEVTDNALQDFSFANSNIRQLPREMSVSGVMSSVIQTGIPSLAAFNQLFTPDSSRYDLIRFQNFQKIADERQPVGVYTPRHGFPTCAITNLSADWDPETGKNTRVTFNFKEIRIISPLTGNFIPDFNESIAGKNKKVGGGQQTPQTSLLQRGPPTSFGNGPNFSTPFA